MQQLWRTLKSKWLFDTIEVSLGRLHCEVAASNYHTAYKKKHVHAKEKLITIVSSEVLSAL